MSTIKVFQDSPTSGNPVYIEDLVAASKQQKLLADIICPRESTDNSYPVDSFKITLLSGFEKKDANSFFPGYMYILGNIYGFDDSIISIPKGNNIYYGSYDSVARTDKSGASYFAYKVYELRYGPPGPTPAGFYFLCTVSEEVFNDFRTIPINSTDGYYKYIFGQKTIRGEALVDNSVPRSALNFSLEVSYAVTEIVPTAYVWKSPADVFAYYTQLKDNNLLVSILLPNANVIGHQLQYCVTNASPSVATEVWLGIPGVQSYKGFAIPASSTIVITLICIRSYSNDLASSNFDTTYKVWSNR
ncbi:MAG: hypothetical protein RSF40_04920 [Oscillospiraceae bacterium]